VGPEFNPWSPLVGIRLRVISRIGVCVRIWQTMFIALEKDTKKPAVACFKVHFLHFPGGTEEDRQSE
jgi:hypothetical protein